MLEQTKFIYLQKGLKVLNDERLDALENEDSTDKIKVLDPKQVKNVIQEGFDIYYHEFIQDGYNDYIKLFFDIDMKVSQLDICNRDLKQFILIILDFITDSISSYSVKNTIEGKIKKYIYNNVTVTRSTNINKISYHIFFNYVYFNVNCMQYLKSKLKQLIMTSENELIKNIDLNVYKKNTKLRTLYSKKDGEEEDNIHLKENKYYNDNILMYLFSYIDVSKYYISFDMKEIDINYKDVDTDIDNALAAFSRQNINLKYLQGYKILISIEKLFIKKKYTATIDSEFAFNLKKRKGFENKEVLNFRFKNDLCICGKTHTNDHYLKFDENCIIMSKHGNSMNCITHTLKYPVLSWYEIGNIVKNDLQILVCTEAGIILIWNGKTWEPLGDRSCLLPIMMKDENISIFNQTADKDAIENKILCGNNIESILSVVRQVRIKNNVYSHCFSFNNGIYDFKKDMFITGNEAKKYINLYNTGYDYIDPKKMTNEERKIYNDNYKFMLDKIDDIIPEYIDGKKNINRENFDIIMSMMLLNTFKGLVIMLVGPTSSGKSTIISFLRSLLGPNNYADISIQNFIDDNDPEKTPKPAMGSMGYKLATFAHESAFNTKFKSVLIKRNTEKYTLARKCYSNDVNQTNIAVHFIDTNFDPVFDQSDDATLRRIGIIRINTSYFVRNVSEEAAEESFTERKKRVIDPRLEEKFNNGELTLPLFHYLKDRLLQYHLDKITIPDFKMETNIDKLRKATVYSAFVNSGNIKDSCKLLYESYPTSSGLRRIGIGSKELKKTCLEEGVINDEEFLNGMEDRVYWCVFKNHIKDIKLVENNRKLLSKVADSMKP